MIRLVFNILFFYCILVSCKGSTSSNKEPENKETVTKDSLEIKVNQLKEFYSKNNYFGFFKSFPNTFDEFLKLYGFDDDKGEMPLYQEGEKHINFFFGSYELNKEYFVPKMFNLAKEGHWEADAPSILQNKIEEFINLNAKESVTYLATKPDEEVMRFWYFVFDGSGKYDLQNKKKFETLYKKINLFDKKQGKLLKEEFDKMYK